MKEHSSQVVEDIIVTSVAHYFHVGWCNRRALLSIYNRQHGNGNNGSFVLQRSQHSPIISKRWENYVKMMCHVHGKKVLGPGLQMSILT